jgi:hypothetical protein
MNIADLGLAQLPEDFEDIQLALARADIRHCVTASLE